MKTFIMTLFIDYLENRLLNELPGINSHLKMAPKIMERSFRNLNPNENAKRSAVMVLIINNPDPEIIFTLRSSKLRSHSGQISFPGGRVEQGESMLEAALRETKEEIGLDAAEINVLGAMSRLYVPPSNSLIYPFVGLLNDTPEIVICEDEVEECFSVPISHFENKSNYAVKKEILEGYEVDMPYWEVSKKTILWGATSMILNELIDLYKDWKQN
jgi:8-oxo-dGTP pyrophosphatase MutT (NUDIX family)